MSESPARGLVGLAALVGGVALIGVARRRNAEAPEPGRWRTVTVRTDALRTVPAPLRGLGDLVDVRVEPAPAGRGIELSARLRDGDPDGPESLVVRATGTDPRQRVREALRSSKQIIEAGEVTRRDPQPHGKRRRTPAGKSIDVAVARSGGEGVL